MIAADITSNVSNPSDYDTARVMSSSRSFMFVIVCLTTVINNCVVSSGLFLPKSLTRMGNISCECVSSAKNQHHRPVLSNEVKAQFDLSLTSQQPGGIFAFGYVISIKRPAHLFRSRSLRRPLYRSVRAANDPTDPKPFRLDGTDARPWDCKQLAD